MSLKKKVKDPEYELVLQGLLLTKQSRKQLLKKLRQDELALSTACAYINSMHATESLGDLLIDLPSHSTIVRRLERLRDRVVDQMYRIGSSK